MGLKTNHDFMLSSLTSMLKKGEQLYTPCYGCLMAEGLFKKTFVNEFGYFGRTNSHLLIAILSPLGNRVKWMNRVPLDIKKVKIHKSFIPKQYVIKIIFHEGRPCKIRLSLKLFGGGFVDQEYNVLNFITFLTEYIN